MKYTVALIFSLLLQNHAIALEDNTKRVVGAIGLNARLKPNIDSEIVLILRPGIIVHTTSTNAVKSNEKKWIEIYDPRDLYKKIKNKIWVVEKYIPKLSSLKDYQPPRKVWITMASERYSFHILKPDGTYLYALPSKIDGNDYGCSKNQTLFEKPEMLEPYCIYKSKLKKFKNLVFGFCGEEFPCNETFVVNNGKYCKLGDEETPAFNFMYQNKKIDVPFICETKKPAKWIKKEQKYFK